MHASCLKRVLAFFVIQKSRNKTHHGLSGGFRGQLVPVPFGNFIYMHACSRDPPFQSACVQQAKIYVELYSLIYIATERLSRRNTTYYTQIYVVLLAATYSPTERKAGVPLYLELVSTYMERRLCSLQKILDLNVIVTIKFYQFSD